MMTLTGVSRRFRIGGGPFRLGRTLDAVQAVDLDVRDGEVLAIVGESGCGKSTLARLMLGLLAPSAGQVLLDGRDVATLDRPTLARAMQPVFQDPYASLNPRHRVGEIVALPLALQRIGTAASRRLRAQEMLERVGLAADHADRLPSQLSGGQRQRVAIARALIADPWLVICDEPTSALDVAAQAQILSLLQSLREGGRRSYVLISHDLAIVRHLATRVAVMYLGRVVELAASDDLFRAPRHPYTRALLASVLSLEPGRGLPEVGLAVAPPDLFEPPPGCAFHPRCPQALTGCSTAAPPVTADSVGRVACHLYGAAQSPSS